MSDEKLESQSNEEALSSQDPRLSLWTIRAEWIGWFYILLVLHAVPLVYAQWWTEHYEVGHDNIASMVVAVVSGAASLIFVAAIVSAIELEVAMVLKHLLEKREARKLRELAEAKFNEGVERGRQIEREEQNRRRDENKLNDEK